MSREGIKDECDVGDQEGAPEIEGRQEPTGRRLWDQPSRALTGGRLRDVPTAEEADGIFQPSRAPNPLNAPLLKPERSADGSCLLTVFDC